MTTTDIDTATEEYSDANHVLHCGCRRLLAELERERTTAKETRQFLFDRAMKAETALAAAEARLAKVVEQNVALTERQHLHDVWAKVDDLQAQLAQARAALINIATGPDDIYLAKEIAARAALAEPKSCECAATVHAPQCPYARAALAEQEGRQ